MIGRYQFTALLLQPVQVPFDDGFVLTVGGNQHFGFPEHPVKGIRIIDQHIAGTAAHKYFYTTDIFLFFIGPQHFVGIVISCTHEKRIVRH